MDGKPRGPLYGLNLRHGNITDLFGVRHGLLSMMRLC